MRKYLLVVTSTLTILMKWNYFIYDRNVLPRLIIHICMYICYIVFFKYSEN